MPRTASPCVSTDVVCEVRFRANCLAIARARRSYALEFANGFTQSRAVDALLDGRAGKAAPLRNYNEGVYRAMGLTGGTYHQSLSLACDLEAPSK